MTHTLFSNSSLRRKVPSHLLSLALLSEGAAPVHVVLDGLSPQCPLTFKAVGVGNCERTRRTCTVSL